MFNIFKGLEVNSCIHGKRCSNIFILSCLVQFKLLQVSCLKIITDLGVEIVNGD